jgi:hypothetical protein
VVELIQNAVLTHTRGHLADDTAILAVRRVGAAAPGASSATRVSDVR